MIGEPVICRTTMTAQILAFLSHVMDPNGGFTEIECEFSGGERYVSLGASGERAAVIQGIYERTIGEFERREKEWLDRQKLEKPPPTAAAAAVGGEEEEEAQFSDSEDSGDGFVVPDEEEDLDVPVPVPPSLAHPYSEAGSLMAISSVANRRNLDTGARRLLHSPRRPHARHRLSSSSSSSSSESSSSTSEVEEASKPVAAAAVSETTGSFGNWRKTGYLRFRVDGQVVAVKERSESTRADWWSGGSAPSPIKALPGYQLTSAERDHLIRVGLDPAVRERLEAVLGIRMEPPPLVSSRQSKGTIVEICTCMTNHISCMHPDCPARGWTESELFDRHFFNKSFARVLAEDAFRLSCLQLEYDVKVVWVCAFQHLVREPESCAAVFARDFVMAPSKFPLNSPLTEEQVS
jgi:hypothetical protein